MQHLTKIMDKRILHLLFLTVLLQTSIYGQNNQNSGIQIIDLSQKQVQLMNQVQNKPIEERNTVLIDSIYKPNSYLWNGYLGSESDFTNWINNTAYNELENYNLKSEDINLSKLNKYFFETVNEMETNLTESGIFFLGLNGQI